MKVAVPGAGAAAPAVAVDVSRHGRHTVMADLDCERAHLEPIRAAGIHTHRVAVDGDGGGEGLGIVLLLTGMAAVRGPGTTPAVSPPS